MAATSIEPSQMCKVCGAVEIVYPDGRGFPPRIAARRLARRCAALGHECVAEYRAGLRFGGPVTGQAAR